MAVKLLCLHAVLCLHAAILESSIEGLEVWFYALFLLCVELLLSPINCHRRLLSLLTIAGVATLGLCLCLTPCPGARVDGCGLADHKAILDQLPDVLPCSKSTVVTVQIPPPCCLSVLLLTSSIFDEHMSSASWQAKTASCCAVCCLHDCCFCHHSC